MFRMFELSKDEVNSISFFKIYEQEFSSTLFHASYLASVVKGCSQDPSVDVEGLYKPEKEIL